MLRRSMLVVALGAFTPALWGCGGDGMVPTCSGAGADNVDAQGNPDPCQKPQEPASCAGECVQAAPFGWEGPGLLWIGSMGETPPECPEDCGRDSDYEGFADPVLPEVCGVCSCAPPAGSCELPTTMLARASLCSMPGGWVTPFDAPSAWDGACADVNPIPQGKDCGGEPCVQSLIINPLKVMESGCVPSQGPPPVPLAGSSWQTQARACKRDEIKACATPGTVCAPAPAPPPAFKQCIYARGDEDCPAGEYAEKFVFYKDLADKRTCAPCQCGDPSGSTCKAALSVFTDASCSVPLPLTVSFDSSGPVCTDIKPQGSALVGKSVSGITYQPGTCPASGGETLGSAEPLKPSTFCCRAKP